MGDPRHGSITRTRCCSRSMGAVQEVTGMPEFPVGYRGGVGRAWVPTSCLPGFQVTARAALCVRLWQQSLAEGSAAPRAVSQGCSRSFSRWSLHWCQRQLPPFRLQSCGPETPCDITCCSPRCPELQLGTGHPDAGGHISPHRCPPVPAMPWAAWWGT